MGPRAIWWWPTGWAFMPGRLVEKDGETVNGKSIMGLMMLAAGYGSKLHVHANGDDAGEALKRLDELLKRKFDEE
jgi:phosphocarrier protein HPr